MPTNVSRRLAVAGAAALSLALAGCGTSSLGSGGGGGSSSSSSSAASADSSLTALVPAAVKSKGTLAVGTDASYAPNEFLEGGSTIKGMDIDLLNAALAKLGLKANFQNAKFDTILPAVVSGKYDLATSSFTITADRLKQVTMVSYFSAGTQWATAKGNPKKVDPTNPCGLSVGVQTGTTQQDELTTLNKTTCKSKPVKMVVEDLQSKVTTDLVAGKVDAMAADSPVTLYAVKQTGDKLQAVGEITGAAPYGLVLPKSETDFGKALAAAFQAMDKDGSYKSILAKWGQTSGAITDFAVNPAATS